jgi:hypothetical protein
MNLMMTKLHFPPVVEKERLKSSISYIKGKQHPLFHSLDVTSMYRYNGLINNHVRYDGLINNHVPVWRFNKQALMIAHHSLDVTSMYRYDVLINKH